MKNLIVWVVAILWLTACASNEPAQTAGSTDDATSSANSLLARKKVCERVRTPGGITRSRRVCKYVDVDLEADTP